MNIHKPRNKAADDLGDRADIRLIGHTRSNHPVEYVPLTRLKDPARRTRIPSDTQIKHLAAGIETYGFIGVVIADADDRIVCGYARVQAAKEAGLVSVPVMRITHLSPGKLKAFRIFDNKISESATWDLDQLALELDEIIQIEPLITPELLGFNGPEFDLVLHPESKSDGADEDGIEPQTVTVSRRGDVWLMAGHKLLNGDAKVPRSYELLLGLELAKQVVSDFPYNVHIPNNVSGLGRVKHGEFVEASGELSDQEFLEFLVSALSAMAASLERGSILHVFMDWRSSHLLVQAALRVGLEFLNICVWDKGSGGMGSLYRSRHEFVHVFKKPGGKHTNNIELGKHGRYRTNVWEVPGLNRFSRERQELLSLHSTPKPVTLIAEAMKDCSNRGDIIVDPFCGSGTALIAAELTGRVARCIELDCAYVDVSIRRFEKRFGIEAVHAVTRRTFAQEAEIRASAAELSSADAPQQASLPRRRGPPA